MGGAEVRILAYVACRGVAKNLQMPQSGLPPLLAPRRFSLPGGWNWGTATAAQAMAAEGALVVAGVAAGGAGAALRSACSDGTAKPPGYETHHLATVANGKSPLRGGPWTPSFQEIFARAGMSLEDEANKVNLFGHYGPHPEEYHAQIFKRLQEALGRCSTQAECRARLLQELKKIGEEVCTPGSRLNRLITKSRP
jgi:hypothetical protein